MDSASKTSSTPHFLSDFLELPSYSGRKAGSLFEKNLKEYRLLLNLLRESLNSLKASDLSKFDPTVGENACQIRAFRIAAAISSGALTVRPELESAIEHAQAQIDELINNSNLGKRYAQPDGVALDSHALFVNHDINVYLTEEEQFAYTSYILTIGREYHDPQKGQEVFSSSPTNSPAKKISLEHNGLFVKEIAKPNFLKLYSNGDAISNKFTLHLIAKAREVLSKSSVEFVHREATSLNDRQLIRMTSEEFQTIHQNRWPCLPMFWTYQTLCMSAEKKQLPIRIQVKFLAEEEERDVIGSDHVLLAAKDGKGYEVVPANEESSFAGLPAVCFEGVSSAMKDALPSKEEWRKHISLHKLELIYAGAADHRQYPDETKDAKLAENAKEAVQDMNRYKNMAYENGFSLKNPKMFFIQHVYPITL